MSGRFAGLRGLQQPDEQQPDEQQQVEPQQGEQVQSHEGPPVEAVHGAGPGEGGASAPEASGGAQKPWEQAASPTEPVKALNGRVPRSVRLAFDRQLTDAMATLGMDVTVDLAVEALARLVIEHDDAREQWLRTLWALKRRA